MNRRNAAFKRNIFILFALIVAFLLFPATTLYAQRGAPPPPLTPPSNSGDLETRDRQIRQMEIDRDRAKANRDSRALLVEVNEDFSRLRTADAELMRANSGGGAPDYKFISDTMIEIKKCSTRLKNNLTLPAEAKREKRAEIKEPDAAQLKTAVAALDGLVQSFVRNPVFRDTGGVDKQLAAKAKGDLDDIISLSERIRKGVDKLNKTTAKSR